MTPDEALLGFIHVYEPAARPDAVTLLLLHGTGGDEHDLVPLVPLLLPNAGILSPRGPVSEHGMPRFFRRLAPGVFDMEDLAKRTADLRQFIDRAAAHYRFDRARVIAVGLSNGANIAANLLLEYGAVVRAAILFRAMPTREIDVEADTPRPTAADRVDVYMNSGRHDRMISAALTERLAEQLRAVGASVTLEWDGSGHELTREAITSAGQWLKDTGVATSSPAAAAP
jgi:predicted esterase